MCVFVQNKKSNFYLQVQENADIKRSYYETVSVAQLQRSSNIISDNNSDNDYDHLFSFISSLLPYYGSIVGKTERRYVNDM